MRVLPARNLQAELRENLCFKSLVPGLSSPFINVPADRIDCLIEARRSICEFLELEHSTPLAGVQR